MYNQTDIMNRATQIDLVQGLCEKLSTYYVFPERAKEICASLQEHLADGDYVDIVEGRFLAFALTTHMQEVSQDEHLWLRWHKEPLPEGEEVLRQSQAWLDAQRQAAENDNYGLYKVERLPGNVGYLDIRYFHKPEWGGETAAAAMNAIANTQALIIDLRKCSGGYPGMAVLISSYLFGEEPVHLNSIYWHDEDLTQQYWTLPIVPGKRYGDKPVYVLISKATFSAGEGFAYNLKTLQRATIIGEKTDGGAHPGASYRLHPHFEAFIPVGRAINPITEENWEGVGVQPDIPVPPEQAFEAAYKIALEAVIEDIGEPISEPFSLLLKEAQAAFMDIETT